MGERLQTAYLRFPPQPGRDITLPLDRPYEVAALSAPNGDGASTGTPPPGNGAAPSGVKFIVGQVGETQEEVMKAAQGKFNLKLVFALVEGAYVADVNVAIKDRNGKMVLEQLVPGPFLLVQLPPGTYEVTATYEGKPRTRKVTVGNRLSTAYLRWPSDPAKDFVPRATAGAKK